MRPITRRTFIGGTASLAALIGTGCADATRTSSSATTTAEATQVLATFDMHVDAIDNLAMTSHPPYSGFDDKFSGTLASANTQVSADRMGKARWVQCHAIWIPDDQGDYKRDISALAWYREAVAWFKDQMEQCADRITQAKRFSDIEGILDEGKVAAILTVENACCLDEGLQVTDEFADDGVLIAGVTWNYPNVLGSGNKDVEVGLTDLGKAYIAALEDHGIVADVSHLNDKGFWDVDAIARKPYVATHSNARAVCNHLRNLTDEQFLAIVARGGVVGLNFEEGFVHEGGGVYTFDELAAHIEHWLGIGGEDAIALGSDRDGASIPTWLADCSIQAFLFERFSERFGDTIARKLFFENALSFFKGLN